MPPRTHLKSSYASATPVTDGDRVYAWFGEFGLLVALNVADGVQVWSFSEPPRKSRENWGFGASPVMHGGRLYLVHDNEEDAYVAAFDALTGRQLWRVKRARETNWSTPWQNDQRTELVVAATGGVTSYDLMRSRFGNCAVCPRLPCPIRWRETEWSMSARDLLRIGSSRSTRSARARPRRLAATAGRSLCPVFSGSRQVPVRD